VGAACASRAVCRAEAGLFGGRGRGSGHSWALAAPGNGHYPGTLPRGIVTTNFVLDGEESSLAVTTEGVEARDGLAAGAQLTIRGTARDLHRIATSANKGKAHSKRFIVDGDRRSADRLLGHLAEGIRRAAAAPVDSGHLPKGGGPRISMPPFRAAEARTRSKSTGADASRAGVSVSLAPR